jgi:CRISPR/Cas system CSM-associated protein Csm3 (group 7 of RAMP superfamily)
MEIATFIKIARNKKGKIHGKIQFTNGTTMSIPKGAKINEGLQNQECEVLRKKGVIARIVINGKEIFSSTTPPSSQGKQNHHKSQKGLKQIQGGYEKKGNVQNPKDKKQTGDAWAPYNFIKLNQIVVEGQAHSPFNIYQKGRFTGYIKCKLETITPLYIRDTYTPEELAKREQGEENPDFFSPGGELIIPGSSLRGMIRNLIEIISWSKFGFFEDKLLFYRGLADTNSDFREEYQKNMSSRDQAGKTIYKFNAGYLHKDGLKYYIIPAMMQNVKQFTQVKKQNKNKEFVTEKEHGGKYRVISGNAPKKKNDWIINPPDYSLKRIPVPDEDVQAYNRDVNRYEDKDKKHDGNLMRMLQFAPEKIVPCFYVGWEDNQKKERISFGHTGYFRLAYNYSTKDYVPSLHNIGFFDFTESLFGSLKKNLVSRIFFEDASLMPDQQNTLFEKAKIPKVLAEPKPTTFQHYLEPDGEMSSHWNTKKYNAEVTIRGNKLYWHRNNPGWEMNKQSLKKVNKKIITQIQPIHAGTIFRFKIRYENLTKEELGLLLFALDLPLGHYHKLGMGKPLGLGSVKLTPTLYISERKERYSKLFHADKWHLSEKTHDNEPFKKAFEKHLLRELKKRKAINEKSLWDIERMRHLKTMLNWENTKIPDWLNKTKYMVIEPDNEFKKRLILPKPDQVGDF